MGAPPLVAGIRGGGGGGREPGEELPEFLRSRLSRARLGEEAGLPDRSRGESTLDDLEPEAARERYKNLHITPPSTSKLLVCFLAAIIPHQVISERMIPTVSAASVGREEAEPEVEGSERRRRWPEEARCAWRPG